MQYGSALYGPLSYEAAEIQQTVASADAPPRSEFPSVNMSRFLELRAPTFWQAISNGRIDRSQDEFQIVSLERLWRIRNG